MEINEKYLSPNDLIQKGIASKATIHRWIKNGKLKSYKFGRSRLIAESDLLAFMTADQNGAHQTAL